MLIVQKYGGTSMGDCDRIHNVAKRVIKSKAQGHKLVVVVSAMGGETDRLINFTQHFTPLPNTREVDMALSAGERVSAALLAIALESMGVKAISLSGRGAGIITDEFHTKARISYIDTTKIFHLLNEDYVVVVAGVQGLSSRLSRNT